MRLHGVPHAQQRLLGLKPSGLSDETPLRALKLKRKTANRVTVMLRSSSSTSSNKEQEKEKPTSDQPIVPDNLVVAMSTISFTVDQLGEKLAKLENCPDRADPSFVKRMKGLDELLTREMLELDAIEHPALRELRRAEIHRIQSFHSRLDALRGSLSD